MGVCGFSLGFRVQGSGLGLRVGMFPLILAVLNKDYNGGFRV